MPFHWAELEHSRHPDGSQQITQEPAAGPPLWHILNWSEIKTKGSSKEGSSINNIRGIAMVEDTLILSYKNSIFAMLVFK